MTRWQVLRAPAARRDLLAVITHIAEAFGPKQARRYSAILLAAIRELEAGPNPPLARPRHELGAGVFALHTARRGARSRHIILYRVIEPGRLEILRILHDAMDLPRHLGLHEDTDPFEYGL